MDNKKQNKDVPKGKIYDQPLPNISSFVSATEFTGLIPAGEKGEADAESYEALSGIYQPAPSDKKLK